jgi:hypothetical protein
MNGLGVAIASGLGVVGVFLGSLEEFVEFLPHYPG